MESCTQVIDIRYHASWPSYACLVAEDELVAMAMSAIGIPITEQVLLCAAMCLVSAWLGKRLVAAENEAADLAAAMRI